MALAWALKNLKFPVTVDSTSHGSINALGFVTFVGIHLHADFRSVAAWLDQIRAGQVWPT